MYAITFDLDAEKLQRTYPGASCANAHAEIRSFLENRGFERVQGSMYMGDKTITAVTCVLVAADLAHKYDWFRVSVRNIRQLRIEADNDLRPALSYSKRDGGDLANADSRHDYSDRQPPLDPPH